MSRSEVKVTRDKTRKTAASSPLTVHCKACAVRRTLQMTSSSSRRYHSVAAGRGNGVTAACVRSMFGKTPLALVLCELDGTQRLMLLVRGS